MEKKGPKWYELDARGLSNLLVVCAGILLYLGLTHIPQVRRVIGGFLNVLSPFIAGFVIAYLLNSPVDFFREKVFSRSKRQRGLAVLTVYALAVVIMLLLLRLVLPQVMDSLLQLVANLTVYLGNLNRLVQELFRWLHLEGAESTELLDQYNALIRDLTSPESIKRFTDLITTSVPQILNVSLSVGNGVVNGIVDGLTALITSLYMLLGKKRLIHQLKKLVYATFPAKGVSRILSVSSQANTIFSGFINGKLLDSAIIGVLCFLLCTIFRIPYAVLVSVVVGVTNVIPFFGPFIGAIPCLMILVIVNPWSALRFGILIIALQQFDGNILGPKILGDSTGLSAIWVLVAIMIGGGLFGFLGMLLGVPTFAVLYSLVREWADERLRKKGIDADGKPLDQPAILEEKESAGKE